MSGAPEDMVSRGRILVVDDERFFREMMESILAGAGYQVATAATGEEAVALFARTPAPVVVLDLVLPDLVGTEVLARLKAIDPEATVVMVTAFASLESAIAALKAGAYDFIQKPIVREDLLAAVERAGERVLLTARNRALVAELSGRLEDLARMGRERDQVFNILHDGLVILDGERRIHDANPRATALLGCGHRDLRGMTLAEAGLALPPHLLASAGDPAGEPARDTIERPAPEGGDARVFDAAVLPFRLDDPGGSGRLVSLSDITEKLKLQRRREEFLSIVSHDLRTPLTSLKGFIELLLAGKYESPAALREYLGILDAEADRMIALINDLLDLSRIDEGKMELHPEECLAEDLVLYAQRSMEGLAGRRGVVLELARGGEAGGGGHPLYADRQRLIQVLVNLLANAIRFSPRGGTVTTEVASGEGALTISVTDQGPGIPPGERERIFDKYRQLRDSAPPRARGSGLGLTIVRSLVALHGGTVEIESPPAGTGSRFVIRLPGRREY
jgi:signal transduction histidine kinase